MWNKKYYEENIQREIDRLMSEEPTPEGLRLYAEQAIRCALSWTDQQLKAIESSPRRRGDVRAAIGCGEVSSLFLKGAAQLLDKAKGLSGSKAND